MKGHGGWRWVLAMSLIACAPMVFRSWMSAQETGAPVAGKAPSGWYQWRGPSRDGISTEKDWSPKFPPGGPKIVWKADIGIGWSAVTVSNGRAYTMGNANNNDTVWCFNADSGEVVWKHSYPCRPVEHPGPRSTPATDGESVWTLSSAGHLFCLDAAKGQVKWKKDALRELGGKVPQWGLSCSPLLLGDWVVLDVGPVVALDRKTGNVVWKSQPYPAGYSSPVPFAMGENRGLAVFNAFGLVVLNAADGKELARHRWQTEYDVNAATPIVSDNKVFISSGYEVGCALLDITKSAPAVVWKNQAIRNHHGSCILYGGYLYGFDESDLKCLEFKTGAEKWSQGGLGKATLLIADGKLIVLSEKGELVTAEASPDGFKPISRARLPLSGTCWTMPVLSGGRIYCRSQDGPLLCVDVSAKAGQ